MDRQSALQAYQYGLDLMDMNQFDPAVSNLSLAITRDPQLVEAYLARARVFMHKQSYQQALEDLLEAVRLQPDLPDVQMQLIAAYRALGRLADALEVCRQAMKQQPDNTRYAQLHDELCTEMEIQSKP
ncbi:MAG: tetratricopeptide repeat protein [candidate division WS1 bacterium]|nr:tetratricopeptide repeat protein [candidate division WS1 bacterium]